MRDSGAHRLLFRTVQRFVGPNIHGADGHGQTLHAVNRALVKQYCSSSSGSLDRPDDSRPMNKNSLRNKPTPTAPAFSAAWVSSGAQYSPIIRFFDHPSSRPECCADATNAPAQLALALFEPILRQDDGAGIDDDHADVAVDDDPIILPDQAAGHARTDDSGMFMLRATMAVCDVLPPTSVAETGKHAA